MQMNSVSVALSVQRIYLVNAIYLKIISYTVKWMNANEKDYLKQVFLLNIFL